MKKDINEVQKNALSLRKDVLENKGKSFNPVLHFEKHKSTKAMLLQDAETVIDTYKALRAGVDGKAPSLVTLGEFIGTYYGFTPDANGGYSQYLRALGIDTGSHSLAHLSSVQELKSAGNWLMPEIITEAVRLGLETNPVSKLIAMVKPVTGLNVTVPQINMADSIPSKMGEAERFKMGRLSYGSKQVGVEKIGIGINISDEVRNYCPIDLLAAELEDVGRNITIAKNSYLIETLLNGEQSDGSGSAPVIGINSVVDGFKYKDIKRVTTRMRNLLRTPQAMIGTEDNEIDISLLAEIVGLIGGVTLLGLNPENSSVKSLDTYSHGLMPDNYLLFVDGLKAINQLVTSPLAIEEERNASNQTNSLYISETFGLYKAMRDAAVILDKSIAYASNGFPDYMNLATYQKKKFGGV